MNSEIMPMPEPEAPQPQKPFQQRAWDLLTAPSKSLQEIGEQRSARLAASFLFAIAALDLVGALARAPRIGFIAAVGGGLGFSLAATLLAYGLARTKWYRAAIFIFALSFSATAYATMIAQGASSDFGTLLLIYVPVSLIVASTFLSAWAVFLLVGLNIGTYLSLQLLGIPLPDGIGAQAGIITLIGIVLMLLSNFRNTIEKVRIEEVQRVNRDLEVLSNELEQRVDARTQELVEANQQTARRARQLNIISELARQLTAIQSLDSLLANIVNLVSEQLEYYHVGIFLNDENNNYAILQAASSEGGKRMLARNHRLQIGLEGIVGFAIDQGYPRIALDVGSDAVYFDNPDLPNTRSEMALPLRAGTEYIGALDIQSTEPNAFSEDDIDVFTTLADQIAIAIQNARQFELVEETLKEMENVSRQQTQQTWRKIRESETLSGYVFDGAKAQPLPEAKQKHQQADIRVPVQLRGTSIGSLKLGFSDPNRIWSEDELAMVQATAERVALALENARLLDGAQRRAARERTIGDISTKLSATTDMNAILRTAVQELGLTMGGAEVILELGTDIEAEEKTA